MDKYKTRMLSLISDYDKALTADAKKKRESSDDYDKAVMGIWRIMNYNLFPLLVDFHDPRKFYSVAGNVRLLMECVADAAYLADHQDKAKEYWTNQTKIQEALKNTKEPWKVFIKGTINHYGELDDKTQKRIQSTLGKDAIGAYNFLCFYTHPNVASFFWINGNSDGSNVKYLLSVVTRLLDQFIKIVDEKTDFEVPADPWISKLKTIYSETGIGKPEIKL